MKTTVSQILRDIIILEVRSWCIRRIWLPINQWISISSSFWNVKIGVQLCLNKPQQTHQRSLNQRWSNVDRQRSSTLIFGWKWKLSWRTFMDVVSTLTKQHWSIVDRITSMKRRWTNLFQRWNLVENESWANVCLSTLFQSWQNNVETTLKELRWFNDDDPMLFQRWY